MLVCVAGPAYLLPPVNALLIEKDQIFPLGQYEDATVCENLSFTLEDAVLFTGFVAPGCEGFEVSEELFD